MPIYLTEYKDLARDGNNYTIPAGQEPAIKTTTATPGAAANFAALDAKCAFCQIHSTVSAHFLVSFAANPAATVSVNDQHLAAGETRFFGVPPGKCTIAHIVGV